MEEQMMTGTTSLPLPHSALPAGPLKSRKEQSLSFPQEYMHSVLPTDSDLKVENIFH